MQEELFSILETFLSLINVILPNIFIFKTRKWHTESADPAKALGLSDILDRNPVVDIHYLLF